MTALDTFYLVIKVKSESGCDIVSVIDCYADICINKFYYQLLNYQLDMSFIPVMVNIVSIRD